MNAQLVEALSAADDSTRLRAALAAGSNPEPNLIDFLVARCAIEPDFYVRDMLTWALTRFPSDITVPKLVAELGSRQPQARSQALHTLSKIRDARAWPAITVPLLRDPNDEVAKSAWRAAVVLVPEEKKKPLADELAALLGRGDREVRMSLSRALISLDEAVVEPAIRKAMQSEDPDVRSHARATERVLRDPDAAFEFDLNEAKRVFVLGKQT